MKKPFFVSLIERSGLLCLLAAAIYGGWIYSRPGQLAVDTELSLDLQSSPDTAVYDELAVEEIVFPEMGRDIFSGEPKTPSVPPQEAVLKPLRLPGRFRLTGVVVDSFPQVVIEDLPAGKTYFIAEGRQEGGLSVLSISPEQVQLEYMGQQYRIMVEGVQ